jgi:hypothetical protein
LGIELDRIREGHLLRRISIFAVRFSEWLLLIFLLAASIPPILIRPNTLAVVSKLTLLDGSWVLDTSYKAATGMWFGRDVSFTYGPLFQWLSSEPSRWLDISTGAVLATWYTLPLLLIILSTFVCARLVLPAASSCRRALLIFLAVVFWSPPDVRVSFCVLAFLVFLRMADPVATHHRLVWLHGVLAALICLAAFLFSADTGVYTTAALILCIVATAITNEAPTQPAKFLAVAGATFAILMLMTNAIMFSAPLNFRFWQSSLAMISTYRWAESLAMAKHSKHIVQETIVMGVIVFAIAWWRRKPDGIDWTLRPAFLVAGFPMAFLLLQSALVRSDLGHVQAGIYCMIFLSGAILIAGLRLPPQLSLGAAILVMVATLVSAQPFPMFRSRHVWAQWQQILKPNITCPNGYQDLDHTCFPSEEAKALRTVSFYIDQQTTAGQSIIVFPYQTAFGLMSRRTVAGGVLQSYLVNGRYLTDLELAALRKTQPRFGLYFSDEDRPLDGVPNFTRSPEVWVYLFRHYQAKNAPVAGFLGLLRDDTRDQRVAFHEQEIAPPIPQIAIHNRMTTVNFGQVQWPSSGADFLKLRLQVNYPLWWKVRKPSCLTLEMSFDDSSNKSIQLVVEPNRLNDVWVYAWDDSDLRRYFFENESQWRIGSRVALTNINLLVTPFDWISVEPTTVAIEGISAVQVDITSDARESFPR